MFQTSTFACLGYASFISACIIGFAVFISNHCFLQYDAKLLKLQKHNVKAQSVHQSSVTSDIYRQVSRGSFRGGGTGTHPPPLDLILPPPKFMLTFLAVQNTIDLPFYYFLIWPPLVGISK